MQEMDESRFCIIPRGNTPWTRRFFDAAVRGCIPAVLSDPVSFPFERLLDLHGGLAAHLKSVHTRRVTDEHTIDV